MNEKLKTVLIKLLLTVPAILICFKNIFIIFLKYILKFLVYIKVISMLMILFEPVIRLWFPPQPPSPLPPIIDDPDAEIYDDPADHDFH